MDDFGAPYSSLACINEEGDVDEDLYFLYNFHQYNDMVLEGEMEESLNETTASLLNHEEVASKPVTTDYSTNKRKRSCFRNQMNKMRDPTTGEIIEITPKMSAWLVYFICGVT